MRLDREEKAMAKNIYTFQQYILNINGKQVWIFRVKAYPKNNNALFTFGKSEYGNITPYSENFLSSKKEGEQRKESMEKYMLETGREVWGYRKHGLLNDYTWEFNEEDRTNYATPKESK